MILLDVNIVNIIFLTQLAELLPIKRGCDYMNT